MRLTESQYLTIVGHCYGGLPDEACGLLLGPLGADHITEARPCRNADASARTYTVDPKDMLAAMRAAEAAGVEIVGVWHSHTHTAAYPSTTDVKQAVDPAWFYVIVSLADGAPQLRCYHIRNGDIEDVTVELTQPA